MGLHYLEAKFGQDMVIMTARVLYAFAVIWIVFVVVGIVAIGLYYARIRYAWTVRQKEKKIRLQLAHVRIQLQEVAEEEENQNSKQASWRQRRWLDSMRPRD